MKCELNAMKYEEVCAFLTQRGVEYEEREIEQVRPNGILTAVPGSPHVDGAAFQSPAKCAASISGARTAPAGSATSSVTTAPPPRHRRNPDQAQRPCPRLFELPPDDPSHQAMANGRRAAQPRCRATVSDANGPQGGW